MKKVVGLFFICCIILTMFGVRVKAEDEQVLSECKYTGNISQEELIEVFPEYKDDFVKVSSKDDNVQKNYNALSDSPERIVKNTIEKLTDEEVKYIVTFYEDDTYTALRYVSNPSLTGGNETTTPTQYSCSGATLTLSDFIIGGNKMFTISPISFTINKSSYDQLDDISSFATAAIESNGKIYNYVQNRNTYYRTETSSRRAGGHYNDIAGSYLAFEVGKNSWRVIYDGSYYDLGSRFISH